jgi:hypothetical protein
MPALLFVLICKFPGYSALAAAAVAIACYLMRHRRAALRDADMAERAAFYNQIQRDLRPRAR